MLLRAGFLRRGGFRQRQLEQRLLLERRRHHQENQQHHQHVNQRDDDDGGRGAAFADGKFHAQKEETFNHQHSTPNISREPDSPSNGQLGVER